jgi:hypothetical protein
MTTITVTLGGKPVTITDIAPYRRELEQTLGRLKALYAGFDPARPERLLAREEEIRTFYNRAEELRVAIESWEAANAACANILAGWELVRELNGGAA